MSAMEQPRRLLGLLLIEMGVISPEQLDEALEIQTQTGERLGEILIDRGFTSRLAIHDALAEQSELFLEPESGYGTGLRAQLVKREGRGEPRSAEGSAGVEPEVDNVVFLHPEEESEEVRSLTAALAEHEQLLAETREELEALRSEHAAEMERHAELERELEVARGGRIEAENDARELALRLDALRQAIDEEAARRVAAETAEERARGELEHLRTERREAERQFTELKRDIEAARGAWKEAEGALAKRDKQLGRLQEEADTRRREVEGLRAEHKERQRQIAELGSELRRVEQAQREDAKARTAEYERERKARERAEEAHAHCDHRLEAVRTEAARAASERADIEAALMEQAQQLRKRELELGELQQESEESQRVRAELHAALAGRDQEVRGLQQASHAAHAEEEARVSELEGWVGRWREANEALKEELARAQSALADRDRRLEALEEESHAHRCDAEARGAVLEQSEAELEQLRGHLRAYENRLRELEDQVRRLRGASM